NVSLSVANAARNPPSQLVLTVLIDALHNVHHQQPPLLKLKREHGGFIKEILIEYRRTVQIRTLAKNIWALVIETLHVTPDGPGERRGEIGTCFAHIWGEQCQSPSLSGAK
ncbi:hypothetical protein FRC03_008382, partial [Tulasnella sp. 419]